VGIEPTTSRSRNGHYGCLRLVSLCFAALYGRRVSLVWPVFAPVVPFFGTVAIRSHFRTDSGFLPAILSARCASLGFPHSRCTTVRLADSVHISCHFLSQSVPDVRLSPTLECGQQPLELVYHLGRKLQCHGDAVLIGRSHATPPRGRQ